MSDPTTEAGCPDCGPVEINISAIRIAESVWGTIHFSFLCPVCGWHTSGPFEDDEHILLVKAGAQLILVGWPDELKEPRDFGNIISQEELLGFTRELADDDLMKQALDDLADEWERKDW